jgi:zinc transport system permease protein
MIANFLESWPLFVDSYLLGWSLSLFLPLLGILIILRKQVFVAMAISQTSVLGMAITLALNVHLFHFYGIPKWLSWLTILGFSLLGSCLCLKPIKWSAEAREMATVTLFILSTVFTFLVLAHAPLGMKEIQERLTSSLISSQPWEWRATFFLTLLLLLFWCRFHRTILLICTEPETAKVMGWSVLKWELLLSAIIGLGLGWSIHLGGWLFTFGGLILPVYMARSLSTRFIHLVWLAPILSLVINFLAYVLAHDLNIPFSQGAVALMGVIWLIFVVFGKKLSSVFRK